MFKELVNPTTVETQQYSLLAKERKWLPWGSREDIVLDAVGLSFMGLMVGSGVGMALALMLSIPPLAFFVPLIFTIFGFATGFNPVPWNAIGDNYRNVYYVLRHRSIETRNSTRVRSEREATALHKGLPSSKAGKWCLMASSYVVPRKYALEYAFQKGEVVVRAENTVYLGNLVKQNTTWYKSERRAFDDTIKDIQQASLAIG